MRFFLSFFFRWTRTNSPANVISRKRVSWGIEEKSDDKSCWKQVSRSIPYEAPWQARTNYESAGLVLEKKKCQRQGRPPVIAKDVPTSRAQRPVTKRGRFHDSISVSFFLCVCECVLIFSSTNRSFQGQRKSEALVGWIWGSCGGRERIITKIERERERERTGGVNLVKNVCREYKWGITSGRAIRTRLENAKTLKQVNNRISAIRREEEHALHHTHTHTHTHTRTQKIYKSEGKSLDWPWDPIIWTKVRQSWSRGKKNEKETEEKLIGVRRPKRERERERERREAKKRRPSSGPIRHLCAFYLRGTVWMNRPREQKKTTTTNV